MSVAVHFGPDSRHPGDIGPYRLLRVLGEGGMGIVYEAEQRVPMHRRVALKVMRPGLDTKEVIARFEAERQALALMEHPGIAKILGAGATEDERPYFVMELVHGQSLRNYADTCKLSIRGRLELFVKVCHAVQHAHLKGVIHRDIKPSNIMVEERDGVAEPRVIDFGIAKATGQRLTDLTLVTELGRALGTPAYMSPEQADASGLDVDTRTDVYSLGVTLYELLVGRLPVDPAEVGPQGFMYQLLMKEVDPPTPSTRYRTLSGEYRSAVATFRRTDPNGLRKELSGDLDAIVMKAIEKDRDRRYDTVHGLALDIQRHLRHEPVLAGSPSAAYRLRKFFRRHRLGVTAGAICAVGLTGGTLLATAGMIRARNAERNAETFARFLEQVFEAPDPYQAQGGMSVEEMLDAGAEKVRTELGGQPEAQARLMNVMGVVYNNLGDYESASSLLDRALALRERLNGPQSLGVAEVLDNLASSAWGRGEYAEAESLLVRALTIKEAKLGPTDLSVANTLDILATVSSAQGNYAAADPLFLRAVGIRESTLGPEHPDVATSLNNLGVLYTRQGTFAQAVPVLQRALTIWETRFGPEHLDLANALNNLGNAYRGLGRDAEVEPLLRRALAIREDRLAPDHPLVATSLNNLGTFYYESNRVADAAPLFRRALAIWEEGLPPNHPDLQAVLSNLGRAYWKLGDLDEAAPLTRRALAILEQSEHPAPRDLVIERLNLAEIYRDQGHYRGAAPLYRGALALLEDSLPGDPLIPEALSSYATSFRRSGDLRAADSLRSLLDARAP